jgi:Protein of unknown function (DUF2695)
MSIPMNDERRRTAMELMTPENPRWNEFIDALDKMGAKFGCDGDHPRYVHRHARTVMEDMGKIDIEGSLAYFRGHGGYCDCEILLTSIASIYGKPMTKRSKAGHMSSICTCVFVRSAKASNAKRREPAPAMAPSAPTKPQRLSLADLRAAAQARRGALTA